MTEAQKKFEEWFEEYADENDIRLAINYGAYEIAGDTWQHQQQRIDELESNLKIAVDALKDIAATNASKHGTSQMMIKRCMFIADDALKQIEVK